ncbi:transporter substrate-binding domain-containing protein [Kiritimatiellaeota bacterium B1221]|nr:transporter substrate-binding domain-containing protein [Kiritimatiellaeota bacterium B1221]
MIKSFFLLLLSFVFLTGCVSSTPAPDPGKLRVGVSPDSPPLIFKQAGQISGVEADFARKISKELGRELVFVEVPWSKQINYLEENKTDIIMSGMTITSTREYRINFTKPFMVAGLTALFRRTDYASAGLIQSVIRHQSSTIGVIKNTTGEIFARNTYTNAKILVYNDKESAVSALKKGKVNMVIHDAPLIWWIAAENEADLAAFPKLLNNESLAWGISKNNSELLEEVNLILEEIKNDKSGEKILQNWFPR